MSRLGGIAQRERGECVQVAWASAKSLDFVMCTTCEIYRIYVITEERLRSPFLLTLVPPPGPQGTQPSLRTCVQTAAKWSLFASGFARFPLSLHPPDLRPDRAEMVAFCIGFCTLPPVGTASGPASTPRRNGRFLHRVSTCEHASKRVDFCRSRCCFAHAMDANSLKIVENHRW